MSLPLTYRRDNNRFDIRHCLVVGRHELLDISKNLTDRLGIIGYRLPNLLTMVNDKLLSGT